MRIEIVGEVDWVEGFGGSYVVRMSDSEGNLHQFAWATSQERPAVGTHVRFTRCKFLWYLDQIDGGDRTRVIAWAYDSLEVIHTP